MFDYFVSYLRVPKDQLTEATRWGNSVLSITYSLDSEKAIRELEVDIANQLDVKSVCLMHWQTVYPPSFSTEHLDLLPIEASISGLQKDMDDMQYYGGGQVVTDLKRLIGEVKQLRSELYSDGIIQQADKKGFKTGIEAAAAMVEPKDKEMAKFIRSLKV